ncbi:hypothetical protein EGK75_11165 [Neisseria weixii]|uniref:Uncharacterized protein n=1 Tax=Neisseria weixii TaxID=1853276 RepID=A0A3N4MKK6_9NEIS|nr:hypothetical protein [Neisseria weixii]RPD84242.1 hypothetical protein EGK74_11265 [Neisseria weixii]RPD84860.1 hypothetical protein EGK75_11165 [Neisseria weixii]
MKKFAALLTAAALSATVLAAQAEKETQTTTVEIQAQQASAPATFEEVVKNAAASDVAASAVSAASAAQ